MTHARLCAVLHLRQQGEKLQQLQQEKLPQQQKLLPQQQQTQLPQQQQTQLPQQQQKLPQQQQKLPQQQQEKLPQQEQEKLLPLPATAMHGIATETVELALPQCLFLPFSCLRSSPVSCSM